MKQVRYELINTPIQISKNNTIKTENMRFRMVLNESWSPDYPNYSRAFSFTLKFENGNKHYLVSTVNPYQLQEDPTNRGSFEGTRTQAAMMFLNYFQNVFSEVEENNKLGEQIRLLSRLNIPHRVDYGRTTFYLNIPKVCITTEPDIGYILSQHISEKKLELVLCDLENQDD